MAWNTPRQPETWSLALTPRQLAADVGIAVLVFFVSLGMAFGDGRDEREVDARDPDGLGIVLVALSALPLVARRRAPLYVFALTGVASAALGALGYPPGPPLGPTVALFTLASSADAAPVRARTTAAVIATVFALHVAAIGFARDEFPTVPLLVGALFWGGAWFVGERVRLRRERFAALEERARRAEREADRERRLAAAEERTRIARDLHDSAGHAINVILVQAGAARLLSERDPERARAALETIEDVARETVGEIDQLVRALRDDGTSAERSDDVEPPPGLGAVDGLIERHRAAGLEVTVAASGSPRALAPAVDQAAYRILQEALTNAARHGRGIATVSLDYTADALEITVTNPSRPDAATRGRGDTHGIVGMRERATLLGGSLEAAAAEGVFRVRTRLPYSGNRP